MRLLTAALQWDAALPDGVCSGVEGLPYMGLPPARDVWRPLGVQKMSRLSTAGSKSMPEWCKGSNPRALRDAVQHYSQM